MPKEARRILNTHQAPLNLRPTPLNNSANPRKCFSPQEALKTEKVPCGHDGRNRRSALAQITSFFAGRTNADAAGPFVGSEASSQLP